MVEGASGGSVRRAGGEGRRTKVEGWRWGGWWVGGVGAWVGLPGGCVLVCVAGWLMGSLVGGGGVGACVLSECLRVRVRAVYHCAPSSEGSEAVHVFAFFFNSIRYNPQGERSSPRWGRSRRGGLCWVGDEAAERRVLMSNLTRLLSGRANSRRPKIDKKATASPAGLSHPIEIASLGVAHRGFVPEFPCARAPVI